MKKKPDIGRRHFIRNAAIGIAGAAVPAGAARLGARPRLGPPQDTSPPRIKEYRILGRTGFEVSDLATGYIQDFGVFSAMLDAGVNTIDTGESYPGSHKLIGRVLKGRDRKKIFLTSKMLPEGDITREGFL
ncbi:MAG: aldo/keto reductase, partial [Candidatus Aminicenantes bacterium]|nr:aldo/keto reductase [Candidatus Aminicenantes bacterium]